ncbi:MAG: phosphatase RsbU N-terminal domain-containing protein [Actinomycetota bacterium]|nr:phosphatase RsbU N-terminal domain-containing protein [Actinomycetota bacterium]
MESFRVAGDQDPGKLSEWGLSGAYAAAFKAFVDGGGEAALEQAYEIGRRAIDSGLGVLDMATIHEAVLETSLRRARSPEACARLIKAAEDFFAETLAPYEMAQRGYRQANSELRELNRTLEKRVEARTRQLREKDRAVRQAYVDVFSAVTGGKLIILTADELVTSLGRPATESCEVNDFKAVVEARARLSKVLDRDFPGLTDIGGLVLAADEALVNAVKHAGGGNYRVFKDGRNAQVLISDSGPGIDFSILPKATLMAGFSTKRTLGMGFSVMLDFCGRVLLATGAGGTSVVLEMK